MKKKHRADQLLCHSGLAATVREAQALILAGRVFSEQRRIDKAGTLLPADTPLKIRSPRNPYVSRGGQKLEGALKSFSIAIDNCIAADFGASTGGFTDCLLKHGARRVYAIDVGYGQLDASLRDDPRVVVLERTNARHLGAADLPEQVDLIVIDASFISLTKLLLPARELLRPGGEVVGLVKPQFEADRRDVEKGGVVRDEAVRRSTVERVMSHAESLGFCFLGSAESVLT